MSLLDSRRKPEDLHGQNMRTPPRQDQFGNQTHNLLAALQLHHLCRAKPIHICHEIICWGHQLRWLRNWSCQRLVQPAAVRRPRGRCLHPAPQCEWHRRLRPSQPLRSLMFCWDSACSSARFYTPTGGIWGGGGCEEHERQSAAKQIGAPCLCSSAFKVLLFNPFWDLSLSIFISGEAFQK